MLQFKLRFRLENNVLQKDMDKLVVSFLKASGSDTAYQIVLDKIDSLLSVDSQKEWGIKDYKDDLKYIEDKLLANSYKSGYENLKNRIDNPEIYEKLNILKLKNITDKSELLDRLRELKQFLLQPLCKETFCMKSIIYNQYSFFIEVNSDKKVGFPFVNNSRDVNSQRHEGYNIIEIDDENEISGRYFNWPCVKI